MLRVGLISDTHRLLRPVATIAPTTAVRGNNDKGAGAEALAETELVRFEEVAVYVVHDLALLDIEPRAASVAVVVSGHSHRPLVQERNGVLSVNPGSAGPRRFKLPISVAELDIAGKSVTSHIADLGDRAPPVGGQSA